MARPQLAGHGDRAGHIDRRRATQIQPLIAHQVIDDGKRLGIGQAVGRVDGGFGKIGRDAALADPFRDRIALGFQFAIHVVLIQSRSVGVRQRDPYVRVLFLQIPANPGDGAARSDSTGEAVDLAVGLAPDFRAGRSVMAAHVGRIVELVRPDHAGIMRFGKFGGKAFRIADIVPGVLIRLCRHKTQVGTEDAKDILLFLALRFRHHDD